MRLIDADELKKKFNERSYWTYTHEYGDAIPIGWIMSGIDNAPTISDGRSIQMNEIEENQVHRLKMALCSLILNADDKQIFKIFEIIWRNDDE